MDFSPLRCKIERRVRAIENPRLQSILLWLWVGLFSLRGLALPFLVAVGALSASQVADWDGSLRLEDGSMGGSGLLPKIYLILLVITIVVLALRRVRSARGSLQSEPAAAPANAQRGKLRD